MCHLKSDARFLQSFSQASQKSKVARNPNSIGDRNGEILGETRLSLLWDPIAVFSEIGSGPSRVYSLKNSDSPSLEKPGYMRSKRLRTTALLLFEIGL